MDEKEKDNVLKAIDYVMHEQLKTIMDGQVKILEKLEGVNSTLDRHDKQIAINKENIKNLKEQVEKSFQKYLAIATLLLLFIGVIIQFADKIIK